MKRCLALISFIRGSFEGLSRRASDKPEIFTGGGGGNGEALMGRRWTEKFSVACFKCSVGGIRLVTSLATGREREGVQKRPRHDRGYFCPVTSSLVDV